MDIFDKCRAFTRSTEVKALGYYPYFKPIEENNGATVVINGKEVIMIGSNNYLGLTIHPEVKEAARKALEKYGTGCSGSRYLNGTLALHEELEEKLADFFGYEAVLLYTTGFMVGQGVLAVIASRGEYIISDKDNHASIVSGTLVAKSLNAEVVRYKTNDMEKLENALKKLPLDAAKLIVTDGVFSMSGFIANLPKFVELKKKYNARLMLDEAHAIGVLGHDGRGTQSHFNMMGTSDMIMGTFSKSFASVGGFLAADKSVIEFIKHHSPALIFAASMPPANVAAVLTALEVMKREPERIKRVNEIGDTIRKELKSYGFNVWDGETPIVPVVIGDDMTVFKFWTELFNNGVFVNAVISPAVPVNAAMLRCSFMSILQDSHIDKFLSTFKKVGKALGVI